MPREPQSPLSCLSCGEPRDNAYCLMCMTCVRSGAPIPDGRSATVHVEQLGNGYWLGQVTMTFPGWSEPINFEGSSFHNAGEALDWARGQIELVVSHV